VFFFGVYVIMDSVLDLKSDYKPYRTISLQRFLIYADHPITAIL